MFAANRRRRSALPVDPFAAAAGAPPEVPATHLITYTSTPNCRHRRRNIVPTKLNAVNNRYTGISDSVPSTHDMARRHVRRRRRSRRQSRPSHHTHSLSLSRAETRAPYPARLRVLRGWGGEAKAEIASTQANPPTHSDDWRSEWHNRPTQHCTLDTASVCVPPDNSPTSHLIHSRTLHCARICAPQTHSSHPAPGASCATPSPTHVARFYFKLSAHAPQTLCVCVSLVGRPTSGGWLTYTYRGSRARSQSTLAHRTDRKDNECLFVDGGGRTESSVCMWCVCVVCVSVDWLGCEGEEVQPPRAMRTQRNRSISSASPATLLKIVWPEDVWRRVQNVRYGSDMNRRYG